MPVQLSDSSNARIWRGPAHGTKYAASSSPQSGQTDKGSVHSFPVGIWREKSTIYGDDFRPTGGAPF
jgi:hypothetical protein